MGIELIENFRFPYFVRTPQAFWRHWHISLSTWLRDYLYIPLGGNRGGACADPPQPAASRWCSAGCGTARRGRSSCGASTRALLLIAYRAADRVRGVRQFAGQSGAARRASPPGP